MGKKGTQGFASMDASKQREIASKGGRAAHAQGRAHEFSHEEAVAAGKKGGQSHSSEHMARIGKLGGQARAKNRARKAAAE
jgi:general stress protein YciG